MCCGTVSESGFSNSFDGAAEPNIYRGSPGTSLPGFRVPVSEAMLPRETGAQENRPLPARPAFKNLARAVAVKTPRVPLSSLWAEGQPLPKSLLLIPGENDRRGRPIKASKSGPVAEVRPCSGFPLKEFFFFSEENPRRIVRPVFEPLVPGDLSYASGSSAAVAVIAGRTSSGRTAPFA